MRTHRLRIALLALVLVAAAFGTACIESDTRATIVIEPDGSGRWIVLQRDIHAVADTPDDRLREEQQFMTEVRAGRHDQAVAFRSLGAADIKTQVVSPDWPFAVQTEARFSNLADVFSRVFDLLGVDGRAALVRDGERTTFTVVLNNADDTKGTGTEAQPNDGRAAQSLFGDPGPVVFLRHGQIVAATGFTVSDDGRTAKINEVNDQEATITLSLTWVATEASTGRK